MASSTSKQSASPHSSSLLPCRRSTTCHACLSFTEEDNHTINFVNYLQKQLSLKGTHSAPVKNDESVIEEARFLVVILSEKYVSSAGCLDELVKIIDSWERRDQVALVPIFYNVDPSLLRDQRGIIAEFFARHEVNFKDEMVKVLRWREALTKVASICGWDSRDWNDEILVEKIVRDISDRLMYPSSKDTAGDLVGISSHIKEMEKKLKLLESNEPHMVGIWGMGGTGKTTITSVIYDMLSSKFECHCFLKNVKDDFKKHGSAHLQKILLSSMPKFGRRNYLTARPYSVGFNGMKRMFHRTKVLLVLDDVDDWKQLEALAGEPNWFGPGSRIIIATRDRHLLDAHGVKDIYEVKCLNTDQALQLFSQHAFRQKNPKIEYLDISYRLISYARKLPLALKVLGSSLYDTNLIEWQKIQEKLEVIPDLKIHDVLKVSFDGLDDTHREVFLDIACFFNKEDKEVVKNTLEACGFFPDIAFAVLKDKALITLEDDMKVRMHDLLQEMGHNIVRQESEDPGKRSRLWIPEDIHHVLTKNMGTRAVEAISLDMSKSREMHLESNALAKMTRLRLLNFYSSYISDYKDNLHFLEGLPSFPNELRYLHWFRFPLKSLPSTFSAENLVKLQLNHSDVQQLWTGGQCQNLKWLDISECVQLMKLPDLSSATKLESIDISYCESLPNVDQSIEHLQNLSYLWLKGCKNLTNLPSLTQLKSLWSLDLSKCSNLKIIPDISTGLQWLDVSDSGVEELSPSIQFLDNLFFFSMRNCTNITSLRINLLLNFVDKGELNISSCPNFHKLPEITGNVREIDLSRTAIEELPSSILSLSSSLVELRMKKCENLKILPDRICELKCLKLFDLTGCSKLQKLPHLYGLSCLEELYLDETALFGLPDDIVSLSSLKILSLSNCKRLQGLPLLPQNLVQLRVVNCTFLKTAEFSTMYDASIEFSDSEICFNYCNCLNLDENARSNILADTRCSLRETATALKNTGNNTAWCSYIVGLPGSKIPEWFTCQSQGCSASINELPPNFLAFGFAVALEFNSDFHNTLDFECECRFENTSGEKCSSSFSCAMEICREYEDRLIFESDHLFLWCDMEYDWLEENSLNIKNASFEFKACKRNNGDQPLKIKKCGVVLLINEKDEQKQWKGNRVQTNLSEAAISGFLQEAKEMDNTNIRCIENNEEKHATLVPDLLEQAVEKDTNFGENKEEESVRVSDRSDCEPSSIKAAPLAEDYKYYPHGRKRKHDQSQE